MSRDLDQALTESYRAHRDAVWGVCYRMTGTRQDADELTQETFLRLRERPPDRLDDSLRNWLLTVAANLCRDRLRRRDEISYTGQWLPAPSAFDASSGWFAREGEQLEQESADRRIERLESASYAFLLALERLTPNQRSVLLLRDVYDFSVRETADALDLTTSNVKTTHHRARKRLEDVEYRAPDDALGEATREVLEDFVECLTARDFDRLEELFREDVRLLSDGGGGEFAAATRPVEHREAVVAFLRGLTEQSSVTSIRFVTLNALPALVIDLEPNSPRQAPRAVARLEIDEAGRISELHFVLSSSKVLETS